MHFQSELKIVFHSKLSLSKLISGHSLISKREYKFVKIQLNSHSCGIFILSLQPLIKNVGINVSSMTSFFTQTIRCGNIKGNTWRVEDDKIKIPQE